MNPVKAGLVERAEDYDWFWQDSTIKLPRYKFKAAGRK